MSQSIRILVLLLFLVPGSPRAIQAEEPKGDPLTRRLVQKLKSELSSESRANRWLAEESLVQLGGTAVEALVSVAEEDAATQLACSRILQRIQIAGAEQALAGKMVGHEVLPDGSLMTTLSLLEQIEQAVPERVRLEPDAKVPEILLEGDRPPVTSWAGIDRFCRTLDWGWDWSLENELVLGPMQPRREAVSTVAGSVRVSGLFHSPIVAAAKEEQLIHATLRLDVSPLIRPMGLTVKDADFVLICEGVRAPPLSPSAVRELSFEEQYTELNLNFRMPDTTPSAGGSFSGVLRIKCAAGEESTLLPTQEIPGEWRRIGETEFRLVELKETELGLQAKLDVGFPSGVVWESYQDLSSLPPVWAKTSQGRMVRATEVELVPQGSGLHGLVCRFGRLRSAQEIVGIQTRLPAIIKTVELPFEFTEVEILAGGIRSP